MSDPLSVTGSAVGIVSFGLALCNAIVRYAQNAQGQGDDMKYLATKATNIRSLLKNLRELIEETENDLPEVAEDLESKASGLQVYLDRLKAPIEKYERAQAAAAGVRSRARRKWETAIYHFKKEELFEVRDCLQSMEMDLNTALNIYSARELHKFGAKQDLLIKKMDTLQLSITATSYQTVFQNPTTSAISCRESFYVQSYGPPVAYNWMNARAKQGRKQYRYYSKWLSRAFTTTFCLSRDPGIFPIVSLQCLVVLDRESWLGKMYFSHGQFGKDRGDGETGTELLQRVDNWIHLFQSAVSEGLLRPTDELSFEGLFFEPNSLNVTLIDLPFHWHSRYYFQVDESHIFQGLCKYIMYMLDCGVTTNYRNRNSAFRQLCKSFIWTEEAHHLACYIIRRCGPINWAPETWIAKRNMQSLLRSEVDCCGSSSSIDLPPAFMAVLRESEKDLQNLLQVESNLKLSPCEYRFDGVTLLQLAMGWPAGVRLLLLKVHPGSSLPDLYHRVFYGLNITDEDDQFDQYLDCSNILLEAGYTILHQNIMWSSSNTLACLLIHELAKRRRKLLAIAEAHLHPAELSDLRKGETGIPDAYAPSLCAALAAKGHQIDPILMSSDTESIYGHLNLRYTGLLDKIYEAGFIDVDLPGKEGHTPFMVQCSYSWNDVSYDSKFIEWSISKGADPFRKLPSSNSTVLHLINVRLAAQIHSESYKSLDNHFYPHVELCHLHQIDMHLFSLTTRDECSCSCSLDGCTPLSVAVRTAAERLFLGDREIAQVASGFRRFLEFLIDRNLSKPEVCHAMIRYLTFDGLSLSHTCCTELRYYSPWNFARDETDLQEIREEQKIRLERFEQLLSEFDAQFDALGLPLMDFLQKIWYERMVKFLSERDKYDPEHHEQTRELGINLKVEEIEIPLVVQLICDQVRVVEGDSEDS